MFVKEMLITLWIQSQVCEKQWHVRSNKDYNQQWWGNEIFVFKWFVHSFFTSSENLIHFYNHSFTNVLMSAIPHVCNAIINIMLHLMIHKQCVT